MPQPLADSHAFMYSYKHSQGSAILCALYTASTLCALQ